MFFKKTFKVCFDWILRPGCGHRRSVALLKRILPIVEQITISVSIALTWSDRIVDTRKIAAFQEVDRMI